MNPREETFIKVFYILTICHVPLKDMRVMLLKHACGMTLREVARVEGVTYQAIDLRLNRITNRMRETRVAKEFLTTL